MCSLVCIPYHYDFKKKAVPLRSPSLILMIQFEGVKGAVVPS